ncbi:MAG: methyltransferase domain-containing protein [Proteobacteria bacterium]|nr:methyltransferase domain-containing protein [Pseudomonadota bacterium]
MAKTRNGHRKPSPERAPGFPARRVAAEAMRRAMREQRQLDEALGLAGADQLPIADRALARAIATVTFRRLGTIRAAIAARLTGERLPEAGILEAALATGVAQILFMEAADHAAVDLAVEIAKADRLALHYAPLANALLRRIAAEKAEILAGAEDPRIDTPGWLYERWAGFYGEDAARAIAARHRMPVSVDLTATGDPRALAEATGGALLPTGSVRLPPDRAIDSLPGYAEGAFFVQDAASALPARLIKVRPGMRVLDLCAAPGGKAAQLALAGARLTAVERSAARAERMRENFARLRIDAEIVIADASTYEAEPFDAVLLDAPCSATGTIRRHPELAWTKKLEDILSLARQQDKILAQAAKLVRVGGTLVYSTCSLEREEGETRIANFLKSQDNYAISPVTPEIIGVEDAAITKEGYLRVLPSHFDAFGGADGFFAARLHRL